MAKGGRTKNKSKRSTIPRGIPQKRSGGGSGGNSNTNKGNNNVISPFEYARTTNSSSRVKHHVHNKSVSGSSSSGKHQQSALAKSIARRKHLLKSQLETQHKSNEFVDRRIGEAGKQQRYNDGMYDDDGKQRRENAMLKRIVAERVRRSKRAGKFSLEDDNDDGGGLTHRVSLCLLVESIYHIITV